MLKMPDPGRDHGDLGFVGFLNTFGIGDGAAGLDDGFDAGLAANVIVSVLGINASEASMEFLAFLPAFLKAVRALSTRLVCPQPMPTVLVPLTSTIAFDLAPLTTFQVKANDSN